MDTAVLIEPLQETGGLVFNKFTVTRYQVASATNSSSTPFQWLWNLGGSQVEEDL